MTRMRYTMAAGPQGKLRMQRATARPDVVCDLGYGIAPGTVIDEGPTPDYYVLWPGKPTTNTVATFVEDYTWFEAFSEEGCATGIACTPALHIQNKRKTEDGRRKER